MLAPSDRDLLERDPAAYASQRVGEILDPFRRRGPGAPSTGLPRPGQPRRAYPAARRRRAPGSWQRHIAGRGRWPQLGSDRRTTTRKPLRRRHRRAHLRCVAPGRCGGEPGNRPPAGRGRRLCAAEGRQQATHESGRIGAASLIGIVLVLLLALRRTRALLAFLPAVAGLAAGTAACIAVFGQIHVLTLVIGTSLLGITIDFPLHWLGKCYGMPAWQADTAMRRVLPGLTVSLSATLVGYLALIFTPFPALTQTAVFSAAGLAIAYGATVLLLPGLMRDWRPRPWPALLHGAAALMTARPAAPAAPANTPGGNAAREHGLRRGPAAARRPRRHAPWLAMPAALIEQARAIGNITGIMPTSQFFLVQAPDTDTLLRRQAELAARLDILVASGSCAATTHSVRLARPLPRKPAHGSPWPLRPPDPTLGTRCALPGFRRP